MHEQESPMLHTFSFPPLLIVFIWVKHASYALNFVSVSFSVSFEFCYGEGYIRAGQLDTVTKECDQVAYVHVNVWKELE